LKNSDFLLSKVDRAIANANDTGAYVVLSGLSLGIAGVTLSLGELLLQEFSPVGLAHSLVVLFLYLILASIFVMLVRSLRSLQDLRKIQIKWLREWESAVHSRREEVDRFPNGQTEKLAEFINILEDGLKHSGFKSYAALNREFIETLGPEEPVVESKPDYVGTLFKRLFDLAMSSF
jgi:hypothetical protein